MCFCLSDVSFGAPLEVVVERALKRGAKLPIPTVVVKCIEFFRANSKFSFFILSNNRKQKEIT
jgi:hypothetical protein